MAQIFISYSRSDRPFLDSFVPLIRRVYGNDSLWFDDDIHGGADWWQMILHEIGTCDLFIYLISNESLESPYCQAEVAEALRLHKQVLPVIVRRLKPAYPGNVPDDLAAVLRRTQYVDLSNGFNDASTLAGLYAAIHRLLEEVPTQPAQPKTAQPIVQPDVQDRRSSWWASLTKRRRVLIAALIGLVGIVAVALIILSSNGTLLPASLRAAYAQAAVYDYHDGNAAWTPITQDFGGVTMVLVPPGCFMMGTSDEQAQYAISELRAQSEWLEAEQPVHEQCFNAAFWIDESEVTQADFERLGGQKANANAFDGDRRPVETITMFEARDFCALRDARLPTEREWEYAARGPDNLIYPWGNTFSENNVVWSDSSNGRTASVGSRPEGASWVGALDISGNVFEWVSSIYGIDDGDYDFSDTGERRISYPYTDTDEREQDIDDRMFVRVLRGGSWDVSDTWILRAPYRGGFNPDSVSYDFGFRCARSI